MVNKDSSVEEKWKAVDEAIGVTRITIGITQGLGVSVSFSRNDVLYGVLPPFLKEAVDQMTAIMSNAIKQEAPTMMPGIASVDILKNEDRPKAKDVLDADEIIEENHG